MLVCIKLRGLTVSAHDSGHSAARRRVRNRDIRNKSVPPPCARRSPAHDRDVTHALRRHQGEARSVRNACPVAVFETTFHQTIPAAVYLHALPLRVGYTALRLSRHFQPLRVDAGRRPAEARSRPPRPYRLLLQPFIDQTDWLTGGPVSAGIEPA